jgi:hypothetical protein
VAWALLGLVLLLGVLTAFVAVPVYGDLNDARRILDGNPENLSAESIDAARANLMSARRRLDGTPARVVRAIPLLGANFDAVDAAAAELLPVTASAAELHRHLQSLESAGLLAGGRIRLDALEGFHEPLAAQHASLVRLAETARDHRTGALFPPLWTALDTLGTRARDLGGAAADARALLGIADGLFGARGERTYLIALINNAELRGAGGVLTGLGTITAHNGRLQLEQLFDHLEFLTSGPIRTVQAPPEYVRRYGEFQANTTLTLNATFSPDVPDVALVAAGIYEAVKGTQTDGVLLVDPRGLAALMPPDAEIEVKGTDEALDKESIARFVYSDAYEVFTDQANRRRVLIEVGRRVFEATLAEGLRNRQALSDAAAAVAGGHIRFVSFDTGEQDVLSDLGATGDLTAPTGDGMLVAVQNFGTTRAGGTKLDYWAVRDESHHCDITTGGASCSTAVRISNETPQGLTPYVAGRPYGRMRDYVEIFVPDHARLLSVEANGDPTKYRLEDQSGYSVISVFTAIDPGKAAAISVSYELLDVGPDSGYRLVAIPQPLSRDATITIDIDAPRDWVVAGRGSDRTDDYRYRGAFTSTITVSAAPDERTGLPAFWEGVKFWE